MYLSLPKVRWFKTEASVALCLLFALISITSSQKKSITGATLKTSMINSHTATIHFNSSTFKSFHDCLCREDTFRCQSNLTYNPQVYNYEAELTQTIHMKETSDQSNYSKLYVCTIPGFHFLQVSPSAIICTRLNKSCAKSNENYPKWSVKIESRTAKLKWVDQTIEEFSSTPDNVVVKNNKYCTDKCDLDCLLHTALEDIAIQIPSEETTTVPLPGADGLDDASETPAGTIVGVVFAVLIVIALIVIGIFFWKRRSRTRRDPTSVTNMNSPAVLGSGHLKTQPMRNGLKQGKQVQGIPVETGRAEGTNGTYETIRDNDNHNASIYNEVSATDTDKNPNDGLSNGASASGNHNDKNLVSSNGDYSQYTYIDETGLHRHEYSRLGDEPTILAHPYNVLLDPEEDPTRRNPLAAPEKSKLEPSRYSLAQTIVEGASGPGIHPTEVIDIAQTGRDPSGNDAVKSPSDKSANDYDYPSDEEAPKRIDQPYFELEKEEDVAEVYTSGGGGKDQPYFELEKEKHIAEVYTSNDKEKDPPYFELEKEDDVADDEVHTSGGKRE